MGFRENRNGPSLTMTRAGLTGITGVRARANVANAQNISPSPPPTSRSPTRRCGSDAPAPSISKGTRRLSPQATSQLPTNTSGGGTNTRGPWVWSITPVLWTETALLVTFDLRKGLRAA